jgi:hypothetical protein
VVRGRVEPPTFRRHRRVRRRRAASRQIAANVALDQTVPHDRLGEVSLRWIYVHIIREHACNADIIREQIGGQTGD